MLRQLFGNKVLASDFHFLFEYIARHLDDFHTVEKRLRHRSERVGSCDEKNFRQIVVDVDIIIVEMVVLLRVEHFEER